MIQSYYIYNKTFITISIVFDKRWKTYICIFKNSGSQKSLYLGKHDLILDTLKQYYRKDEFDNSVDFLKRLKNDDETKKRKSVPFKLVRTRNISGVTSLIPH